MDWLPPSEHPIYDQLLKSNMERDRTRRRVVDIIFSGFLMLLGVFGAHLAFTDPRLSKKLLGIALLIAGFVPIYRFARWFGRAVIEIRRLRAGRCVHCNHEYKGVPQIRCTECGQDPTGDLSP